MEYDFGGYATRNDIECSDGRVIRKDAFKDQDHTKVPMVYMHDHMAISNVLGHCLLENRPDGVYVYGKFNDTPEGLHAKESVETFRLFQSMRIVLSKTVATSFMALFEK